jgi:hypothetical protein
MLHGCTKFYQYYDYNLIQKIRQYQAFQTSEMAPIRREVSNKIQFNNNAIRLLFDEEYWQVQGP